ncbi:MAG: flagellar biosynthetic protein FliO [Mobilicoccus sp.]|nr:flagellar biosynthetic protein FliO [Mobilicoccus sp.]
MTEGSLTLTILRAVFSLALVLGLIVLCFRILARRTGITPTGRGPAPVLDVLARRQLSRTSSVQIVRVGERVIVLGVTDSNISVLTHLSTTDVPADEDEDGPQDAPTITTADLAGFTRRGRFDRFAAGTRRAGRHRGGPRT